MSLEFYYMQPIIYDYVFMLVYPRLGISRPTLRKMLRLDY